MAPCQGAGARSSAGIAGSYVELPPAATPEPLKSLRVIFPAACREQKECTPEIPRRLRRGSFIGPVLSLWDKGCDRLDDGHRFVKGRPAELTEPMTRAGGVAAFYVNP